MSSDTVNVLNGVFVGFVLSQAGLLLRDWWIARGAKQSLATALLTEVMSQANWCCERGSRWNLLVHGGKIPVKTARQDRPPEAPVYAALVEQIARLATKDASSVIAFYGAVSVVRSRIDSYEHVIRNGDLSDLASKWQAACFNALLAIGALEPVANIPRLPNDESAIASLKQGLTIVAEGGVIQAERDQRARTS